MCVERHVVDDIRSVGSFVSEGARVDPGGEVQVMPHCSKPRQFADSVSILVSVLVWCLWSFNPFFCICRSRAICLQGWACV